MDGRLFIEGQEVDLSEGLSNQITYAIDDIVNTDSKSTAFSKTIILPGTTKNNNILGNIFDIRASNFSVDDQANVFYNFNAARSADCRYEINGLQVIKGVIRVLEIIIDGKFIEYEVSIIGELGGFIAKLANKRLQDLDFSQYDHTYTIDNIVQSWDEAFTYSVNTSTTFTAATKKIKVNLALLRNLSAGMTFTIAGTASNNGTYTVASIVFSPTVWDRFTEITVVESLVNETDSSFSISFDQPNGVGYYYGLIDYGNVSTDKINFQYSAFRPGMFLREYMRKIIEGNGYTFESNFFDTAFFKRLVVPNNQKGLFKYGVTDYVNAANTVNQQTGGSGINTQNVAFATSTLNNFTVDGSNSIFTYIGVSPITTKATLKVTGTFKRPGASSSLKILLGSTEGISEYEFPQAANYTAFDEEIELTSLFNTGNTLSVAMISNGQPLAGLNDLIITSAELLLQKDPPGFVELLIGDQVKINDSLPQGVFQKDFFTSVLKMFNLMVTEDKFIEKRLVIEPYPDFYQTTDYLDWSDKVNRGEVVKIKPMSELNARFYQFKFKQDNDFYNENYRKKYNEGYGDRIFDTAYDFAKDTETVEVIFAASPLFGADGTDKIYPAIYKKSANDSLEETIDHVLRIGQIKKITGVSSWDILNADTVLTSLTNYGYIGHLDDPDAPSSDINFGAPFQLYFTLVSGNLTANLFNAYYSPYLAEITDKDSRLMTASFKLDLQDIYDLDFKRLIYIDGALFRLMKVIDFNTNLNELTKCELLKVISLSY